MTKVVSAHEAVGVIQDGASVASVGVIGWCTPDAVLKAIADRFESTASPRDLTFYFPVGTGDAQEIRGMDHVAREGLMKRVIAGSYINPVHPRTGERPALMRLIRENRVEAYSWPIGATMHWLREVARRSPGYITRVGLGTYIDPANGGGKFTARATADLVRRIEIDGEPLLFYPSWPIDVALIHATTADEDGNLSFEEEALVSSSIALALAARASGGTVIAQVRRLSERGARAASAIGLPGLFVDKIVVEPDAMMTTDVDFEAAYFGGRRTPLADLPRPAMAPDKVVAARAAREVRPRELSIFGFGAAADIPLVMAEQGVINDETVGDYWFTTEHGSYGGVVMSGWQFSANINPTAILDGVTQFDAIDGGQCRFAALAFAQFDAAGVVNVAKFGNANPGAGGFIDIAHNAQRLVFTGTFTTGGLEVAYENGAMRIVREGAVRKFVRRADHVTYDVAAGIAGRGQSALIVTERAVFQVTSDGLVLLEIAPGMDLKRDLLDQMEFLPVRIADPLPLMDATFFQMAGQVASTNRSA